MKILALLAITVAYVQAGALEGAFHDLLNQVFERTSTGFKINLGQHLQAEYTQNDDGGTFHEVWNSGRGSASNEVNFEWGHGFFKSSDKGNRVNVVDNPLYPFGKLDGWTNFECNSEYQWNQQGFGWKNNFNMDGNVFAEQGYFRITKANINRLSFEIRGKNTVTGTNLGYFDRFREVNPYFPDACVVGNNYCHNMDITLRAKASKLCKKGPLRPGCSATLSAKGTFGVPVEYEINYAARNGGFTLLGQRYGLKITSDGFTVVISTKKINGAWNYRATLPGPRSRQSIRSAVLTKAAPLITFGLGFKSDVLANIVWFDEYKNKFNGKFDCTSIVTATKIDIPALNWPAHLKSGCNMIDMYANFGINKAADGVADGRKIVQAALARQNVVRGLASKM